MNGFPQRIVSGGQSGADRAALDFAIAHGIPHGGWRPAGRLTQAKHLLGQAFGLGDVEKRSGLLWKEIGST
jgi:hypothetical protein